MGDYARAILKNSLILSLGKPAIGRRMPVITHRLGATRHTDRIAVIHEGRVIEMDDHDALIAQTWRAN
ncbi:hypothetical protein [Paracoccus kondratievae]|uniref:ABC transporter ATP-binding protein n=1 Tax=Paracoccus kondratievae TaxID=135740 RepID=A0AAD3P095_9RHOB|nr:hypothetical protein [Paracoccus kondratievae]GLK64595.1 hypothetical protein GCM10017635_20660 [Paracoccus kondratievae]